MDAHVQTAKKGKSRQPSAFSLPGSGIQKYRFVLAGLLFILLPFLWAFIFLLPGNLLAFLRLPALPGGGSSFSPGLGTPVFILTGCWLLWKPRSARPAALAMAFTPLQKPVAFLVLIGFSPAFPALLLLCGLAAAVLAALLWKPLDAPAKPGKLQVIAVALIALSFLHMPGLFVLSRIEAMQEHAEPFWGPRLQAAQLPEQVPAGYTHRHLLGVAFSLPSDNWQIAAFEPRESTCILVSGDNLVQLENPAFAHILYDDLYYLLEKDAATLEQKSLTSPCMVYSLFRLIEDCPAGVYKFCKDNCTGFAVLNSYASRIKLYSDDGAQSAEIYLRHGSSAPDLFAVAASMEFAAPAPADRYFAQGQACLLSNDIIGAQFAFANACWLEPDNPEYLFMLAGAISENTRPDGTRGGIYLATARHLLKQALEISPEYMEAVELLEALTALEEE